MREIKGNLVDYVIPTALVGIVAGLALFALLNSGNLLGFLSKSVDGKVEQEELIIGERSDLIEPGDIDGEPGNPKMQCEFGYCTIDFGDYILRGIPEEIASVNSANRGGDATVAYYELLEQLADQLEENYPAMASILDEMAREAKKMALIEKAAAEALDRLNNQQQKLNQLAGDTYQKVETGLNQIDPNSLNNDDYQTMLAATAFLKSQGVISQDETKDMAMIILDIKNDAPNLEQWQIDFINTLKNSPDQVNDLINNTAANLSASDQALVINTNSTLYEVATGVMDKTLNSVSSGDDGQMIDPGNNFYNLVTQLEGLPPSAIHEDVRNAALFISSQIQTIGDSIEQTEQSIDGYGGVIVGLEIPEDAGISTAVAADMLASLQ
jgi:hypothetical protein